MRRLSPASVDPRPWTGACAAAGLAAVLFSVGCDRPLSNTATSQHDYSCDLTATERTALANARIFFGHQSVGANIMRGVVEVARARQLDIRVVSRMNGAHEHGWFLHAEIGRNGNALSKTDAFAAVLDNGLADRVTIAFHKFCYTDVSARTDAQALLEKYREKMNNLAARYPDITFVHVTVPLTSSPPRWKTWAKWLLQSGNSDVADNRRREEYNSLLRRRYGNREPIFDLAALESGAAPDVRGLRPDYTDDGDHLNEVGRQRVADALINSLARIALSQEQK